MALKLFTPRPLPLDVSSSHFSAMRYRGWTTAEDAAFLGIPYDPCYDTVDEGVVRAARDVVGASSIHGAHSISLLCEEEWPMVRRAVMERCGLPPERFDNLLTYTSSVIRCVVYVVVVDGAVRVFAPLCARRFRNRFHANLRGDVAALEKIAGTPRETWYLNGSLVCERPGRDLWGDYFFLEMKCMVQEALAHLPRRGTFEFCMNKRDCAMVTSPPGLDPYTRLPLPASVLPASLNLPAFLSFYSGDGYADLPIPLPHDRFRAAAPRPSPAWAEKERRVFFRGGATGGGTRVRMVQSAACVAKAYPTSPIAIDAAITSVPKRWRWRAEDGGGGMAVSTSPAPVPRQLMAAPVPEHEWGRYRWLLYCDGNAGATRWLGMFLHGSAVISVPDPSCMSPRMWARDRMTAGVHYIQAESAEPQALDRAIHSSLHAYDIAASGREAAEALVAEIASGAAMARVISSLQASNVEPDLRTA